jgi:maleate isomerase
VTDSRWHYDGWQAQARLGVVVPHADVGPEAELNAMAPPTLSIHAARLHFSAMRAGGEMDPTIPHDPVRAFVEPPHVDDCVELLAASPLDVIACGFTSSAYKHGAAGEQELMERLGKRARGMPVISTCLAAEKALRALEAHKPALVNPPWFDAELDEQGAKYFADQGFDVVHHAPCGIPSGQPHVTPSVMFDWVRSIAEGADSVFIAGNGLRAVGVIAALEDELGIPILTANQVLLWYAMQLTGVETPVQGYGQLFKTIG